MVWWIVSATPIFLWEWKMKSLVAGILVIMGGMVVVLIGLNDPVQQPRVGFISEAPVSGSNVSSGLIR